MDFLRKNGKNISRTSRTNLSFRLSLSLTGQRTALRLWSLPQSSTKIFQPSIKLEVAIFIRELSYLLLLEPGANFCSLKTITERLIILMWPKGKFSRGSIDTLLSNNSKQVLDTLRLGILRKRFYLLISRVFKRFSTNTFSNN